MTSREPGSTPVPSQLRKTVSPIEILALGRIQTHSLGTVFIVTPETGLRQEQYSYS